MIVPVRNEEAHIQDQLAALAAQSYRSQWEVVIVDNGCTDRSMDIAQGWAYRLPSLRIVSASAKRGLNYARNVGAASARGNLLAFCDADDATTPGWLVSLAAAAPGADLIGGSFGTEALNDRGTIVEICDDSLDALPMAFGVGKTVLCALLVAGLDATYWKPIQTGASEGTDRESVRAWTGATEERLPTERYRFDPPVSPHLASREAGVRIDLESLQLPAVASPNPRWIVEGAGGVMVPVNDRDLMRDLMRRIGFPIIIAARTALGTINHTLLTLSTA